MPLRLFVEAPLSAGLSLDLPETAARHVQVRRLQPGDALVLFDGRGGEWRAQVQAMGRRDVRVGVGEFVDVDREPVRAVTLAVGMPANERMDTLVEKATELGMAALQPLLCERAVLRLDGERAERRREHWRAIAVAASEQSGRTRVPEIAPVRPFAQWLAHAPAGVLLSPGAGPWLREDAADAVRALTVLSGPEGGFTPQEVAAAQAQGFRPLGLGPRVLRADTAPLAALVVALGGT